MAQKYVAKEKEMLADKFYEFLEALNKPLDDPYIVDYGKEIFVEGHIPKDKLEKFLKEISKGE